MSVNTENKPNSNLSGVLQNRNFSKLFFARIISQLGDQIYTFAISWYILNVTQSSLKMAVPLILTTVITAFFSLFGGIIADRLDRKRVMVNTDVVQGVVLLTMAWLMHRDFMPIWMIYVFTVVLALCSSMFSPAASAIVPDIVEKNQLADATSANQFTISFCSMMGMILGGVLYSLTGILSILIFNAASNFLSAVLESRIIMPFKPREKAGYSLQKGVRKTIHELSEGCGYVKEHRGIFYLLSVNSAFNFFALPVGLVYIPYYFNVVLHSTSMHLAVVQASLWLGMILSTFLIPLVLRCHKLTRLVSRGLIWMSLCTLAGVLLTLPWMIKVLTQEYIMILWMIINLCCGISVNLFIVPMYTLFQKHTDEEYRGRFWGIENSTRTLAMCGGYLFAGLMAQRVWLGFLFAAAAFFQLAIAIWSRSIASIQKLE